MPSNTPHVHQSTASIENDQSAAPALTEIIQDAISRSYKRSGTEELAQNCTYNAYALKQALSEQDIVARVVRGAARSNDEPTPAELDMGDSLEEYIGHVGNGHWWVEAQLTPDTWWTVDIYSLVPERHGQPLVMAGRPTNYILAETNPDRPLWS